MPTTRKPITRRPIRRITKLAVDIFDTMDALAQRCTCAPDATVRCDACEEWWTHHRTLHAELKLRPWEWPAYSDFANDDPKAMQRYDALKAASDAAKVKRNERYG
jgi:hypothetical protein